MQSLPDPIRHSIATRKRVPGLGLGFAGLRRFKKEGGNQGTLPRDQYGLLVN